MGKSANFQHTVAKNGLKVYWSNGCGGMTLGEIELINLINLSLSILSNFQIFTFYLFLMTWWTIVKNLIPLKVCLFMT